MPPQIFQDAAATGENCHFSHSPKAPSPPPWPPINRASSVTTLPGWSGNIRSWEAGPDANLQLVQAINSLRGEAGQGSLDKTHKFFEILRGFCRLEEEDLDAATDTLQKSLPFAGQAIDYDSQDESDDRYNSEEEDDDFGDMDLFSPLKKITPKYMEPTFSARQTANYPRNSYSFTNNLRQESFFDWDLLDNPSVVNVQFGVNFGIEDSHIAGFIARPVVCRRLLRFAAGDPNTGNGGGVRNEAAFIQFVRLCPNIRVFRLDAFTSLSDTTLLAIFEACPHIEMVQLTGHDKVHGSVSGTALKTLARAPHLAPNLKALYLYDQSDSHQSLKALSKARPRLWIHTGEMLGNSMSAQLLAAEPGGEAITNTWLGGKIVSIFGDCGSLAPSGGRHGFW
ncbi:hypothetical protein MSAN_01257600 [Mycena sanguinolenta]|uniref:Uncharacterized protein n=1 Tax=Mycena sanguinolenta TaxID=230812 RepID=A0A8H6YDM1_9AGAR|nr:hypothetical protein MSAN_01257600 [Mycena sanguinolenta]